MVVAAAVTTAATTAVAVTTFGGSSYCCSFSAAALTTAAATTAAATTAVAAAADQLNRCGGKGRAIAFFFSICLCYRGDDSCNVYRKAVIIFVGGIYETIPTAGAR